MTTSAEQLNVLPSDIEAERGVLGSMLLVNDAIDLVDLHPADFHIHGHECIYAAIKDAWNSGHRAIDATTLASELERRGTLTDAGGPSQLIDILDSVPHAEHVRYYANIVRHKSKLRQIINIGRDTTAAGYKLDAAPDELLATIDRRSLAICEASTQSDFATMDDAVDALEERKNDPAAVHSTGLMDFDRQLNGGLKDGQLVIVGGRPGTGKTIMVDQIAVAFAQRGEPALICSLEMRREEIAERYAKTLERRTLRRLPIQIVDTAHTLPRITSLIRLAQRRDHIRQSVLEGLGWNIVRVWSTDWVRNPETQMQRILDAYDVAVAGHANPTTDYTEFDDDDLEPEIVEPAPDVNVVATKTYSNIDEVPSTDILERAQSILVQAGATGHEDLMRMIARNLGFSRLGQRIRERLDRQLAEEIRLGNLRRVGERITLTSADVSQR